MKARFFWMVLVFVGFGCSRSNQDSISLHQAALEKKAVQINEDLGKIRSEVKWLAGEITYLYERQDSILPHIDQSKYKLAANGVFSKPIDDGGSAVFVSGFYPVNEAIRKIVYFTEPIDGTFKRLVKGFPEIVQVYYNDKYALNRIYPYFDVLSQYEAKMNIPEFNFYFLADAEHNPKRDAVWVNEPYIDPAGRGWMVSAIAPVYFQGKLVGVPGIDITVNTVTNRYIQDRSEDNLLIIDNTGTIVSAQESTVNLLSFPPLSDHKYIETIKQDTYRKESYNLKLSKEENVRKIGIEILDKKSTLFQTEINGNKLTVLASHIPETDWYLLEIMN
jgi:hypothetical protein